MENFELVERLQAAHHVDEELPDVALLEELRTSCVLDYFHVEVAAIRVLHDDAERLALFLEEGFLVSHDVRMSRVFEKSDLPDRGENADLVERVFLLLRRELDHLHFLQRVLLSVRQTLHPVHNAVCALAYSRSDTMKKRGEETRT